MKKILFACLVCGLLCLTTVGCKNKRSDWSLLEVRNIEFFGDGKPQVRIISPMEEGISTLRIGDKYHGLQILDIHSDHIVLMGLDGDKVRIGKGESKKVELKD